MIDETHPLRTGPDEDVVGAISESIDDLIDEHGIAAVYWSLEEVREDLRDRMKEHVRQYQVKNSDIPIEHCPECESTEIRESHHIDATGLLATTTLICEDCEHRWRVSNARLHEVKHADTEAGAA